MLNIRPLKALSLLTVMLLLLQLKAEAQCCSPGTPVSGSEYVGITPVRTIRSITFYRHSFSDTYYEGGEVSGYQGTTAGFDYIGEVLSYGILNRLSAELELGCFVNRFQNSDVLGRFTTHGFSNAVVTAKYAAVKIKDNLELTVGAGAKLPVSRKIFGDEYGVPYPQEIQPSTGAYGFVGQLFFHYSMEQKWKLIVLNRYEINGYNAENYRFGDTWIASVYIGRTFARHWTATLQLRSEFRLEDWQGEARYLATGGEVLFLSPQISYTFKPKLTLSVTGDIPVYRNYNGIQLSPKYAIGISLVKDFCL
ncbi:MAG: transporter [Bacteroidales bacterium]|nr:transporter [Bacteroidales bacterium]